jgi:large subunit ribosomal protein L31
MKPGIHPNYGPAKIICACGNVIETRSTMPEIRVEVCSACHSFFTGKATQLMTAGRVEKFTKKFKRATTGAATAPASS